MLPLKFRLVCGCLRLRVFLGPANLEGGWRCVHSATDSRIGAIHGSAQASGAGRLTCAGTTREGGGNRTCMTSLGDRWVTVGATSEHLHLGQRSAKGRECPLLAVESLGMCGPCTARRVRASTSGIISLGMSAVDRPEQPLRRSARASVTPSVTVNPRTRLIHRARSGHGVVGPARQRDSLLRKTLHFSLGRNAGAGSTTMRQASSRWLRFPWTL